VDKTTSRVLKLNKWIVMYVFGQVERRNCIVEF
jgi:hypothetical protein